MTFYAQRKIIKNGEPVVTPTNKIGTREEMERQFHLFCASACVNGDNNDLDAVEWGTLEQGVIERKVYNHPAPEPEPEEQTEPEEA